jgi:hypothetical protein
MNKQTCTIHDQLEQIRFILESALADSAKYPQLEMHEIQEARLNEVLKLIGVKK